MGGNLVKMVYCLSHGKIELLVQNGTFSLNEQSKGPHHYAAGDPQFVHEGKLEECGKCRK